MAKWRVGKRSIAIRHWRLAIRCCTTSPCGTRRTRQCARVEGVPPEEFGIARHARSIRDADYCFHDVLRSEAKLIAQGYDRGQIKRLPSYAAADTVEAQARDSVGEGTQKQGDDGLNSASRLIRVTEHYVRMDYESSGTAREAAAPQEHQGVHAGLDGLRSEPPDAGKRPDAQTLSRDHRR